MTFEQATTLASALSVGIVVPRKNSEDTRELSHVVLTSDIPGEYGVAYTYEAGYTSWDVVACAGASDKSRRLAYEWNNKCSK